MKEKTVIELAHERADQPEQKAVHRVVDAVASYMYSGEIRAVASLAILNGGRTYSASYSGLTRADRLQLIGLLDELKAALLEHEDQPLIERLPSK